MKTLNTNHNDSCLMRTILFQLFDITNMPIKVTPKDEIQ